MNLERKIADLEKNSKKIEPKKVEAVHEDTEDLALTLSISEVWRVFSLFFFSDRDLVLDVKDQIPKAQPSTFKIQALSFFLKRDIFGKNATKWKIRYSEI